MPNKKSSEYQNSKSNYQKQQSNQRGIQRSQRFQEQSRPDGPQEVSDTQVRIENSDVRRFPGTCPQARAAGTGGQKTTIESGGPKRNPMPPPLPKPKWIKPSHSGKSISQEKVSGLGDSRSTKPLGNKPTKSETDVADLETSMESLELHSPLSAPSISASGDTTDVPKQTHISGNQIQCRRPKCKSYGNFLNPFSSIENLKASGIGTEGRRIKVLANHFPLKLQLSEVTHYDIKFEVEEYKRPPKKSDANLLFRTFREMIRLNAHVFKNPNSVVFDGFANVYSATFLNFGNTASKFVTAVEVIEDEGLTRKLHITITLTRVNEIPIKRAIEEFERYGRSQMVTAHTSRLSQNRIRSGKSTSHEEYLEAVRVINVVLGMLTRSKPQNFCINNAKHFSNHQKDKIIDIGSGKYIWLGTFKSVRTGWKVHLNVDMANKPGYEESSVQVFIMKYFRLRDERELDGTFKKKFLMEKLSSELRGLKVRFIRPDGEKRNYRANGVTDLPAQRLIFESDGVKTNVVDYFGKTYHCKIQHPNWPCLHVGAREKNIWIPIEYMQIQKQACPRNKKLDEFQAADMVKKTAIPPQDRKRRIEENLRDMGQCFKDDKYAQAFEISVHDKLLTIDGRILNPPEIEYRSSQPNHNRGPPNIEPRYGKWDMARTRGCNFMNAKELRYWGVLDLCRDLTDNDWSRCYDQICQEAERCGVRIVDAPLAGYGKMEIRSAEDEFRKLYNQIAHNCKNRGDSNARPQLILVISEGKSMVYDNLKLIGDTSDGIAWGIPTQFVLKRNVQRMNAQLAHNVLLKINSKLGGTNQIISSRFLQKALPVMFKEPIMFIGADVTHVTPGDKVQEHPSIAAVVGSVDVQASVYKVQVKLQYGGQVFEVIKDLSRMVMQLLKQFYQYSKGTKPTRLIYFRDGVSEGQFEEVVLKELTAIQKACQSLGDGSYQPNITFIVAQKRHNTRLFPQNEADGVGKMKNVPPGTVVDTVITHPTEMSYFLVSHEGIQGTSRPTKYHLLSDDSGFTADELQKMTYFLCHLYSRCERSVSYPAPTYYAHLAAFRGRAHHNAFLEKCRNTKMTAAERKQHEENIEKVCLMNYFM